MTTAPPPTRRATSISTRLTLVLLPLVVLPLLVLGAAAYLRAQQLIRTQAASQLASTTTAEFRVLQEWVKARGVRLALASQENTLLQPLATMLVAAASPSARTQVISSLEDLTSGSDPLFSQVMIVSAADHRVVAADDMSLEGALVTAIDQGKIPLDQLATTAIYNDPLLAPNDVAFVTSIPMSARGGDFDSYLVGVNRGLPVGTLMAQLQQSLWEQRGGYRIERGQALLALSPNVIVTYPRYATEAQVTANVSHPVFDLAKANLSGVAEYLSFSSLPVVGAYQWAEGQNMGLVLEMPQSDVYAGLTGLAPFFAGLLAVTILAALLLVPLVTRQSLRPLTALAQVVERLSRGQFDQRVPVGRRDEIGRLADSFNAMADELSSMYHSLEDRVAQRTYQIRTASEVARDAAFIRDVDTLLDQVVRLISERFGFYHAGIFLVDGDDAVLRAASSDGGQRMLARGHRLAVGKVGLVGYVTGSGKPRLALDVGADAVHFANPDLPHTHSEVALPLRVGDRILGALDVQSTESNAFDENDVVVLQTMADQLATALENASLLDNLRRQSADRQNVIELYARLAQQPSYDQLLMQLAGDVCRTLGYRRAQLGLVEGDEIVIRSAADEREAHPRALGMVVPAGQGLLGQAVAHGDFVQQPEREGEVDQVSIAFPLRSAGRTIGSLAVTRAGATRASPEELELLRLLAAPLAAALENARLVEESQRSLREIDSLYQQQAAEAWQQILRARHPATGEGTYQPGAPPAGDESEIMAPIEVRGEVIGALDIQGRAGAELDQEDEIILEAVADELAGALEQARLMEEIRRRAVQLQAAAEISRETTSQLDSSTLLERAVHLLHDRFGYDQVAVYRLDWQTSSATVEAAAGKGAETLLQDRHHVPVGSQNVIGFVTQSGNSYAANDDAEDPYFQVTPYLPEGRAELGLPLMVGDQVFGAIVIRHSQPHAFARDDITVLEVLADQIAVGVQNARLFEATLRRAQREQAVVEITSKIRTSGGIDGILRTAVREMRVAMGARQAQIWLNAPALPPTGGNGGDGKGAGA